MRKFTTILIMVFLIAVVATDSMIPNEALANNDGGPEIMPVDGMVFDDLIMEQSGNANDGSSGDPDGAGDGYGFMGEVWSESADDLIDKDFLAIQEYICRLMGQLIPMH